MLCSNPEFFVMDRNEPRAVSVASRAMPRELKTFRRGYLVRHWCALTIALVTLFASVGASAEMRVTRLDEQRQFADIDLSGEITQAVVFGSFLRFL